MPAGRPHTYKPEYSKDLVEYFKEGFKADDDPIPFFRKWCINKEIPKSTAYDWANKDHTSHVVEFSDAFETAKDLQFCWLVRGGLNGEFNSGFAKLIAINLLDMVDKSEVNQRVTDLTARDPDLSMLTDEEVRIRAQIEKKVMDGQKDKA